MPLISHNQKTTRLDLLWPTLAELSLVPHPLHISRLSSSETSQRLRNTIDPSPSALEGKYLPNQALTKEKRYSIEEGPLFIPDSFHSDSEQRRNQKSHEISKSKWTLNKSLYYL